ncbi:MAG TPA: hypothetical protein VJ044_03190 [Candidatus Hodarchaeales archaeon]|nr:hypothetical protein [Candidatus Hodarchaeales archaeon]
MRAAECHPDKKHHAKGMCERCYNRQYFREYERTPKRKVYMKEYRQKPKRKTYDEKYNRTEECKDRKHKRQSTPEYKAYKREYDRKYHVKRYRTDQNYRLANILRSRANKAMKEKVKTGSAVQDLGCSLEEFRNHIEGQFLPEMSWDNHGEWHLDHIIPLASFDLTDREQFLKAAHYSNYQPLWADENLRKGSKVLVK